jgi:hypothetical protein
MTAWYQTAEAEEFMAFAEFATHRSCCAANRIVSDEKAIVQPLIVPFVMIMRHELSDRVAQSILAEKDHLLQAVFSYCPDKALRRRH